MSIGNTIYNLYRGGEYSITTLPNIGKDVIL